MFMFLHIVFSALSIHRGGEMSVYVKVYTPYGEMSDTPCLFIWTIRYWRCTECQ